MPFDACRPILIAVSHSAPENSRHAPPRPWAGFAGRAHGDERGSATGRQATRNDNHNEGERT